MSGTFYDLLGVSDDASTADIEAAYREAIKEVHPDVSDEVDASERTKRLNKAKRVLTDDTERTRYDRMGHEAYTGDGAGTDGDGTDRRSGASQSRSTRTTGSGGQSTATGGSGSDADRRRRQRRRKRQSQGSGPDWATSQGVNGRTWAGNAGGTRDSADGGSAGQRSGGDVGQRNDEQAQQSSASRAGQSRTSATGQPSGGTAGQSSGGSGRWTGEAGGAGQGASTSTGPSRGSYGPSWQSQGSTATAGGVDSRSARRQAAAGSTDGPNADWSWNAWERTRSWAVRESDRETGSFHPSRLFPLEQSMLLLATSFVLYPIFILSIVYQPFPLFSRVTVAVCTVLMFAYLLSFPEVAIFVYGVWSVLVPLLLFLIPGLGIFSLAGVIGLSATWVPLGISVLALSVIRT